MKKEVIMIAPNISTQTMGMAYSILFYSVLLCAFLLDSVVRAFSHKRFKSRPYTTTGERSYKLCIYSLST